MRIIAVVVIAFIIGLAAGLGGGYIAFSPKQGGAVKKLHRRNTHRGLIWPDR